MTVSCLLGHPWVGTSLFLPKCPLLLLSATTSSRLKEREQLSSISFLSDLDVEWRCKKGGCQLHARKQEDRLTARLWVQASQPMD